MKAFNENFKRTLSWLKWSVLTFVVSLSISGGLLATASHYRNEAQRREISALSNYDWLSDEVATIEKSLEIIETHGQNYRQLVASSILGEENRVALLEDIRIIRERHKLFPLDVEIKEQQRVVIPYPENLQEVDEQLSLRGSLVQVKIPMLHEYDLTRFLNDFLNLDRLMFTNNCTVTEAILNEEDLLDLIEHQVAICDFYWLTLQREPFNPDEHSY